MALKKTIAGYYNDKKEWIDQKDILMHPLEEYAIMKQWAMHDIELKMPVQITKEQEHEWLIEFGADYIKQKRKEYQINYQNSLPQFEAAHKVYLEAHEKWKEHCDYCLINRLNHDIHDKEKYLIE